MTRLTTKRRMIATTKAPCPSSDLKVVDIEDKARIFYRLGFARIGVSLLGKK